MVSGTTPSNHRNTLKSQIIDGRNLSEDGKSHSFTQEFSITFYVCGPFHRLRQLWKYLREKQVVLSRTQREDLYAGTIDVLKVEVPSPSAFEELFKEINHQFSDLSYYDVDIPLILRYAAAFGVFPLAYCKVEDSGDYPQVGMQ